MIVMMLPTMICFVSGSSSIIANEVLFKKTDEVTFELQTAWAAPLLNR
jgi:hypothetical protein